MKPIRNDYPYITAEGNEVPRDEVEWDLMKNGDIGLVWQTDGSKLFVGLPITERRNNNGDR